MRATIGLFTLLGLGWLASTTAQAQQPAGFIVIVNVSNPTTSLSKAELTRLFLKKKIRWEHDTAALPVDQKPDAAVRDAFSKAVLDKSVSSVKAFWQKTIFSGRGVPPPELASDSQVIAYVQGHAGGVGYISSETNPGGTKVISVAE